MSGRNSGSAALCGPATTAGVACFYLSLEVNGPAVTLAGYGSVGFLICCGCAVKSCCDEHEKNKRRTEASASLPLLEHRTAPAYPQQHSNMA